MNDEIAEILQRENLTLAPVQKRAVAMMIDELLLSLLLMLVLWDAFAGANGIEEIIGLTNAFILEFMAIKIVYQTFFVYQYGATLGKIVIKIQVLEISTLSSPSIISAFNRAVFRVISEMFFYLGFIWGMMDPNNQTWHDKSARTLVVDA